MRHSSLLPSLLPVPGLLAAALLTVPAALWAQQLASDVNDPVGSGAPAVLDLPQMGEPADSALSPAQEAELGQRVVAQLYQYEYILEDVQLTEYMNALGWKLVAASPQKPPQLSVFVVRDPRINAFALPGGYVGFNAGLLLASHSESEVAGVMAHELVHVTQRHIARSQEAAGGLATFATWAAVLGAIIAGSADPDVVLAALSLGQGISYQRQVNFTRANELEADRIGIQTLADAGFDPEGMASFFQRLEQQSRLYGTGIPEILRTHPVNTTRVAEARARAAAMKPRQVIESSDYRLMQSRARVLTYSRPSEAIDVYAAEIQGGRDTPGNRYGLAMGLHQLGQNERAITVLRPALESDPRQVTLNLMMAQLELGAGRTAEGLARFEQTLGWHPRHAPAIIEYASALIDSGKPEQARQVLLSHEQSLGTRLETYRLLAQAAHQTRNDAEASYQMANYLYRRGDAGGALAQLDAGLRLASLSQHDRARLAARRAEVRESLPRNYDPYQRQQRQAAFR